MFTILNFRRARRWPALLGSLAWVLVEYGQYWLARRLMKGHEERTDLKGWMLAHLARALIAGAQFAGAMAVCRRALALPADGRTASVRLHLAPMIALDDPEAARREVDAARTSDLEDDEPFLAGMSEALVLHARDRADPAGTERLTATLAALWRRPGTRPSYVARRIYDHVVDRLASGRDAKAWRAQLRRLPLGF